MNNSAGAFQVDDCSPILVAGALAYGVINAISLMVDLFSS